MPHDETIRYVEKLTQYVEGDAVMIPAVLYLERVLVNEVVAELGEMSEEISDVFASNDYWVRFGKLVDLLDRRVNGTVPWQGGEVAQPWDKRVSTWMCIHALVEMLRNVESLGDALRRGTQYDEKNLPPKE